MKTLLLVLMLAVSAAVSPAAKPELSGTEKLDITKRAHTIILPKVDYRESRITDIVAHLNQASKEIDPERVGVPIELSAAAKASKATITISLQNIPLIEILKYVTNLSNLQYKVTSSKIVIVPLDEK